MEFSQRFSAQVAAIDAHLRVVLADAVAKTTPDCGSHGRRLAAAMHDAVLSGGKRLRPILVIECAALLDVTIEKCLNAAAAVECIHCYSLVHDDLPCMDNDELRRGKPTVWKAYDEWTAVLAGDALLTLAFELLSRPATDVEPGQRLSMINRLSRAAGAAGMVQGQALDLAASKLDFAKQPTLANTLNLQSLKTGALIRASCEIGGVLGQANPKDIAALTRFGAALGLAFQIGDDLLDFEGTPDTVGKATGKDAREGKATLVQVVGEKAAREKLELALKDADHALQGFGKKANRLINILSFVAGRRH